MKVVRLFLILILLFKSVIVTAVTTEISQLVKKLQMARTMYFEARIRYELSNILERKRLKFRLNKDLLHFEQCNLPEYTLQQYQHADHLLNDMYRKFFSKDFKEDRPLIRKGILSTERAWIKYRDAWVNYGKIRCPKVSGERWKTLMTIVRNNELAELMQGYRKIPNHFPADLLYAEKPINSFCFSGLGGGSHTIDLRHCNIGTEKYVFKNVPSDLNKQGYIGYDWDDPEYSLPGYSYYKFFDAGKHQYWIYAMNNGGGSGHFTDIYLVRRMDPYSLTVQSVMSGDRCASGINEVTLKNKKLSFSINLNYAHLMTLATQKLSDIDLYDVLSGCPLCCIGTAEYEVDLSLSPRLIDVDLTLDMYGSESPNIGKQQNCLNDLLKNHTKMGQVQNLL